ncbi:glutathione transferase 10 [Stylonychia lemnae]|uniref:Glutathione transferase 10 n=1 Tax=Stylonychia lemnae TaxID=5949 RepID=A0A078B0V8_STYLE|nr:glutathione transferase 10 [Stylonychia lemnae]|eukprot:CDW86738.1 glutathione transferase 10 [Stylonychia lemnae]
MKATSDLKKLIVYGDYLSQPFRAVMAFILMNKIPCEEKIFRIMTKEHQNSDYFKISPQGKVPAITDGEVALFESHAILRYLKTTRSTPDHWYPDSDFQRRAKIDEYLDWQHSGLRETSLKYLIQRLAAPTAEVKLSDSNLIDLKKSLKLIDSYWLKDEKQQYLVGNQISIADLSCVCHLTQLKLVPEDILNDFPKIKNYQDSLMQIPEILKVHELMIKLEKTQKAKFEKHIKDALQKGKI